MRKFNYELIWQYLLNTQHLGLNRRQILRNVLHFLVVNRITALFLERKIVERYEKTNLRYIVSVGASWPKPVKMVCKEQNRHSLARANGRETCRWDVRRAVLCGCVYIHTHTTCLYVCVCMYIHTHISKSSPRPPRHSGRPKTKSPKLRAPDTHQIELWFNSKRYIYMI